MTIIIGNGTHSGAVTYNGVVDVLQGGSIGSLTLTTGGTAEIAGVVSAATVSGGAVVSVTNGGVVGGVVGGATILSGGVQSVFSGGVASHTVVQSGGRETVAAGGNVQSGLVSGGGTEVFTVGAQLLHETVLAGGTLVESGLSLATSMTLGVLAANETLNIIGALLTGVVDTVGLDIVAGGALSVMANTTDSGSTIETGGKLTDFGGNVSGDTVAAGGVMTVASGVVSGITVAGQLNVFTAGVIAIDSGSVVSGVGAIESGAGQQNGLPEFALLIADTVEAGGQLTVGNLAIASGTDVASGGTATVVAGGLLSAASVGNSGFVAVSALGTAAGTVVSAGGHLAISGGLGSAATVDSGGNEVVGKAGISEFSTVSAGGTQTVLATGTSKLAVVDSGGTLAFDVGAFISAGLVAVGGTLSEQGLDLSPGLVMTDAGITAAPEVVNVVGTRLFTGIVETISAGVGNLAILTVSAGGTDLSGTIGSGGTLLLDGGVASATQVSQGGTATINSGTMVGAVVSGGVQVVGGTMSAATVAAGIVTVSNGGNDISTTVSGTGQEVLSGGAKFDTVASGGSILVANHGQFDNGTVLSGGHLTFQAQAAASQLLVGSGGSASFLTSSLMGDTTTIDGTGKLTVQSGLVRVGNVIFTGTGGTLVTGQGGSHAFGGFISGFVLGDTIDLSSVAYSSGGTATVLNNLLDVVENGTTHELQFANNITGDNFTLESDGATGTNVLMTLLCFLEGTRIATPDGEMAVEHLRPGDTVRLAGGGTAPVAWVGRRAVDIDRHPRPEAVRPVRVRANAFGPGLPARDLFLSPDHAVYVDGVLIPVRHLVNGDAIARDTGRTRATYWHIELAAHDVVLAEGLPCESYLDAGNRAAFDNAGGVTHLHPDFAQRLWDADACAPLVVAGPRLERARAMLRGRAPLAGDAGDMPRRRRVGRAGRGDEVGPVR